ncbi:histidine--tRNA ligase [Nanoarchaeota archaeon]
MKIETAKGVKDYSPREKALRDNVTATLKAVFERYGFNPLETPIIERWDILAGKYAGGSEILKEAYKFQDQGERELGLRYDLTVPLSRYVAMNPTIKLPFKRYQIGQVFRDGPIKAGRLRQFWQADVDIVGSNAILADAECIKVALDAFDALGMQITVKVNDRKLLNQMVESAGIPQDKASDAIIALDKLEKIGAAAVVKEMTEKGIAEDSANNLMNSVNSAQPNEDMNKLLESINDKRVIFTPSLARGLTYYTGTVFEVFASGLDSSVAAGGRYDDMIGKMAGRGAYPAVGISFGIEPICELLKDREVTSLTKVLIVPIGINAVDDIAKEIRKAGINTSVDITGRGPSKGLDYANSYKIPFVLLIGQQEIEQGKYKLKDMNSGEEKLLSVEELIQRLK